MALSPEMAQFDENKNGLIDPGAETTNYVNSITSVSTAANPKAGTSVSTKAIKLSTATAKALLENAAQQADYGGKFTSADIAAFIKAFDDAQKLQIEKVITSTAQKTTPATTQGAVDKTMETTARTEYPSLFDPAQFTSDYVWEKINFTNEKTLGTKSSVALAQVRGVLGAFQLLGVSDDEAKVAAKQIAMGKKTLAEYTADLQKVAIKEYPQFADRFKSDPTLTTRGIAGPAIDIVAETLEIDKNSVTLAHPVVRAWLDYAGPDGKGVAPTRYQLKLMAKKLPEYKQTEQAINEARDGAVSMGRALGFGI